MDREDPGRKQRKVLLLHPIKSTLASLMNGSKNKSILINTRQGHLEHTCSPLSALLPF